MRRLLAQPENAAFANHIQFLARHRGELAIDDDGIRIRAASADFSTWTPAPRAMTIPADCRAVRLAPWSPADWYGVLARAGFAPGETLSYMELQDPAPALPVDPAARIEIVRSPEQARAFADVQASGFATGDAAADDWWAGLFRAAAESNRLDAQQTFYLGYYADVAAATTLALRANGVTGIYAVATRPQYRRRGQAGALLGRVRADVLAHGPGRIILQAMSGSYAEGYYARLGFRSSYQLTVWRQAPEQGE